MLVYISFMTRCFPVSFHFVSYLQTSSRLGSSTASSYSKLFKSNGTLLTLPARYLLAPPANVLGRGSCESSWNLQRESWTRNMPSPADFPRPTPALPRGEPGPEEEPPPLVSVYEAGLVASSIERRGVSCCCCCCCARGVGTPGAERRDGRLDGGGGGGGGGSETGAGAEVGGGGGAFGAELEGGGGGGGIGGAAAA